MKKSNIFIALAIIILVFLVFIAIDKAKIKEEKSENKVTSIVDLREFKLENRSLVLKENILIVGENSKQIENGYYDFKIIDNNNEIVICLNKLWCKSYGQDYIEDEYLAKICREITRVLNINEKQELDYELYKYIKNNFINVKQGLISEKRQLEDITISSESINGECIIYIRV